MRTVSLGWLVSVAVGAAAQERQPAVELAWSAPRGCPDRAAVLRILQERLPHRSTAVALRAQAKVQRQGARYRLQLELEREDGRASRTLDSAHCEPLAEAAAVLILLAIEGETDAAPVDAPVGTPVEAEAIADPAAPNSPPASASTAQTPAAPAPAPQEGNIAETGPPQITHEQRAQDGTAERLHLQLSAAARADLGTFPHEPALGVQAQLAARIRPLYAAIGATYWPAREQRSASYPNARLHGSGVFADLSLGADISATPVVLTPALNVELGRLDAQAEGIAGPEGKRVFWLAFGPCVSAAMPFSDDWKVALEFAALIPAYRNHWRVRTPEGDVPAFDAASVAARVALRISYELR